MGLRLPFHPVENRADESQFVGRRLAHRLIRQPGSVSKRANNPGKTFISRQRDIVTPDRGGVA